MLAHLTFVCFTIALPFGPSFQLLADKEVRSPLLISGDVHFAELSAYSCGGVLLPELTTSGMTHAWGFANQKHDWWPVHYLKHWFMINFQVSSLEITLVQNCQNMPLFHPTE